MVWVMSASNGSETCTCPTDVESDFLENQGMKKYIQLDYDVKP